MDTEEGKKIRCPKCSSLIAEPPSSLYQCPVCSSLFLGMTNKSSSSGSCSRRKERSSHRRNTVHHADDNAPVKAKLISKATRDLSGHLSPKKERSKQLMHSLGTPFYEPWNNINPFVWPLQESSDYFHIRTKDNPSKQQVMNQTVVDKEHIKLQHDSYHAASLSAETTSISFSFPASLQSSVSSDVNIQKKQTSCRGGHVNISGMSDVSKDRLLHGLLDDKHGNAKSSYNAMKNPPLGEVRAHHLITSEEVSHYGLGASYLSMKNFDSLHFDESIHEQSEEETNNHPDESIDEQAKMERNNDEQGQAKVSPSKLAMSTAEFLDSHQCIFCIHEQYHRSKSQDVQGSNEHESRNPVTRCKFSLKGSKMSKIYPPLPRSGGSPFVLCRNCNEILEVPGSLSPREGSVQRLRCSSCGKISKFQVLVQGNSPFLQTNPTVGFSFGVKAH